MTFRSDQASHPLFDEDTAPPLKQDWGDRLIAILALSLLVFSWTAILGSLSVVIQLGLLACLIYVRPVTVADALRRCWPLVVVALLMAASAAWSDERGVSLRYGVQGALTVLIGIAISAVTSLRAWVRFWFLAAFIICLVCIGYGQKGISAEGPVLIGILGSKNAMAVLAQLVLTSALAVLIDGGQPRWSRLLTLPAMPVALYVLATSHSAGGLITAALGVILLLGFRVLGLLKPRGRVLLTVLMLLMLPPLVIALPDLVAGAEDFSLTVLRKDPGLTGRDYLWAFADRLIAEKPILGHGYRATWLGHGSTTIGLLRWAGLTDGRGFHFHDTYREWAVDFGLVGAVIIALALGASLVKVLIRSVTHPSAPLAFTISMFLILAVRAKVENIFMPFAPTTVLLFGLAASAWLWPVRPPDEEPAGRRLSRGSTQAPQPDPRADE